MTIPGVAGELARRLPPAARHDPYDAVGAPIYHQLGEGDFAEVPELRRLLRGIRGPLLELACGAGRLTFGLLATGVAVTALDRSPAMIELLEQETSRSGARRRAARRLTALVADMRDFALDARFEAIVLGTSSITLLDRPGRAACLACVRRHLADGGRFLVSVLDVPAVEGETVSTLPGGIALHESVDPAAGRRWTTVVIDGEAGSPPTVLTSAPFLLSPAALGAELERAGLEVVSRHAVDIGATADGRTHWILECAPR
jgi:methylation protein MtfA